jgi:hypothetical protein
MKTLEQMYGQSVCRYRRIYYEHEGLLCGERIKKELHNESKRKGMYNNVLELISLLMPCY